MAIKKDYSRDNKFDTLGLTRLRESYMRSDEASPQDRFAFIAEAFGSNEEHTQRMYEILSKHWFSASTPVLSFGKNKKGLPISCYLNYIDDSAEGLVNNEAETNWLSILGGGVGIHLGIRAADSKSTGAMPHLKVYDASTRAYRQSETRRGSYAVYMDISHPDITLFLEMRKPTGDPNLRCLDLNNAVNIPNSFMEIIENCMKDPNANDDWSLIDPHSGEIKEVVSAKALWQKIIELRASSGGNGEPYLHFIDTSNEALPQWLKDKGLKVHGSNLCSEIILPTSKERTAVCCLGSFNLEYWDDYRDDYQVFRDVAEFQDNILQYFIDNAPSVIERAVHSARSERSIGIGALGFHTYLQSKMISFESAVAKSVNRKIFKTIRKHLDQANLELGAQRGEAPDAKGTGLRFSHLMAIAPNASTSIIMGNISPSIEPMKANVYRQDTMSGIYVNKNKYLRKLLEAKHTENPDLNLEDIWSSIISNDGSVQHLECLDYYEKEVFKTAFELNQLWIIEHAADRQQFIDQAQSINLFFRPDADIKYVHAVHFAAWKMKLKTLYYYRSSKIRSADKIGQQGIRVDLNKLIEDQGTCLACEG